MYVARFKWMFRRKFGCTPLVKYKIGLRYFNSLSLDDLLHIINTKLRERTPFDLPEGIATKSRQRHIVEYRHMYFKFAKDMGFGLCTTGRSIGFNHATVVHGAKSINDLLDAKNKTITILYKDLEECIFKHIEHETIVEDDFAELKNNDDEISV